MIKLSVILKFIQKKNVFILDMSYIQKYYKVVISRSFYIGTKTGKSMKKNMYTQNEALVYIIIQCLIKSVYKNKKKSQCTGQHSTADTRTHSLQFNQKRICYQVLQKLWKGWRSRFCTYFTAIIPSLWTFFMIIKAAMATVGGCYVSNLLTTRLSCLCYNSCQQNRCLPFLFH